MNETDWAKIEEEGKQIDEILHSMEEEGEKQRQRQHEEHCADIVLTGLKSLLAHGKLTIPREWLE